MKKNTESKNFEKIDSKIDKPYFTNHPRNTKNKEIQYKILEQNSEYLLLTQLPRF